MVLNNGEWTEIQHDSTLWLKCVPPCVPLLRSIRPVAHLRLTPWELTRQWKWGTGHDWQHQQNVYFWIAQPPAPWELLSSAIFFPQFSTWISLSWGHVQCSGKLGETPADHVARGEAVLPGPSGGINRPTGQGVWHLDGLKPTVSGQSLMKCAIMCDSFLVILVFNLRHLPNLINFHANSIFFTRQSYHKKGAVVGTNLSPEDRNVWWRRDAQGWPSFSVRLTPISSTRDSQLQNLSTKSVSGPNMEDTLKWSKIIW